MDYLQAVSEVCVLAIQSPCMTLRKMLHDAVDNPGQQPLLVKVCFDQLQFKRLFFNLCQNSKKKETLNTLE